MLLWVQLPRAPRRLPVGKLPLPDRTHLAYQRRNPGGMLPKVQPQWLSSDLRVALLYLAPGWRTLRSILDSPDPLRARCPQRRYCPDRRVSVVAEGDFSCLLVAF